jgi:hypothetical protein
MNEILYITQIPAFLNFLLLPMNISQAKKSFKWWQNNMYKMYNDPK